MIKLPAYFTTVTPLSKTLAAVLFITLPILGFLLGMEYQKLLTPDNWTAISAPNGLVNDNRDLSFERACTENNGTWLVEYNECEGVSEAVCREYGGEYEDCTSFCRHQPGYPDVVCIQICVPVCKFYE